MSEGRDALLQALAALARALRQAAAPHMLIGGMAAIVRGVARHTDDIDATVWAEGIDLERLVENLSSHGIVGRIADVVAFARESQVLLLRHQPSGTPMDITLAWLPFEQAAIAHAEKTDVLGIELPVVTAEDLIIYKAVAGRDRDRVDLERLLRIHGERVDIERIRDIVGQFAEALDEPERLTAFDALVAATQRD